MNRTGTSLEISMFTHNPKKAACVPGGTYTTVGDGSIVLKLMSECYMNYVITVLNMNKR